MKQDEIVCIYFHSSKIYIINNHIIGYYYYYTVHVRLCCAKQNSTSRQWNSTWDSTVVLKEIIFCKSNSSV